MWILVTLSFRREDYLNDNNENTSQVFQKPHSDVMVTTSTLYTVYGSILLWQTADWEGDICTVAES